MCTPRFVFDKPIPNVDEIVDNPRDVKGGDGGGSSDDEDYVAHRSRKGEILDTHGEEEESKTNLTLNAIFEKHVLSDFPAPPAGEILILRSDQTVRSALADLVKRNYLSAPVRDVNVSSDAPWTEAFIGLIDMIDIVCFVLGLFGDEDIKKSAVDFRGSFSEYLNFIVEVGDVSISDVTVAAVLKDKKRRLGDADPFLGLIPVYEQYTLLHALIALGKNKLRRFVVIPMEGHDILNIITQSAVCRIIQENLEDKSNSQLLSAITSKTLKDVGLGDMRPVYAVDVRDTVLDAYQQIAFYNVSAIPVVDKQDGNKLKGSISATDIRSLLADNVNRMLARLQEPAFKFAVAVHFKINKDFPGIAVNCKEDDKLIDVLNKMVKFKIHRVYLVDETDRLLRVISLSDFLAVLVK